MSRVQGMQEASSWFGDNRGNGDERRFAADGDKPVFPLHPALYSLQFPRGDCPRGFYRVELYFDGVVFYGEDCAVAEGGVAHPLAGDEAVGGRRIEARVLCGDFGAGFFHQLLRIIPWY